MSTAAEPFHRDRATVMAYGGLGCYAYGLYALGPLLPLLRTDLHLSYLLMSLHSALFAAGVLGPGLGFARWALRYGYRTILWSSAGVFAVGAAGLASGPSVAVTLPSIAVMGFGGSTLQITTLTILSIHQRDHRERALVEANAGGSAAAVLAPVALGLFRAAGLSWRVSLWAVTGACITLYLLFRRVSVVQDGTGPRTTAAAGRLPGTFWVAAALCATVVGTEFCVVFYGSSQLGVATGLAAAPAATAMSAFFLGELIGRLGGSALARDSGRARPLVVAALALTSAAFAVFWSSHNPWIAVGGLVLLGLGVANLFPLTLALAVTAAPGMADRATARVQLLVGAAIVAAPLLLGALADRFGVVRALAVAPAMILIAAGLLTASCSTARRSPQVARTVEEALR